MAALPRPSLPPAAAPRRAPGTGPGALCRLPPLPALAGATLLALRPAVTGAGTGHLRRLPAIATTVGHARGALCLFGTGIRYDPRLQAPWGPAAAGRLLADFLALCLPAWSDAELLPVPLARRRLRERGFNQASEIARRLGLPVRHGCLQRVGEGPHQQDLGAAERQRNVRGRFALRRAPPAGAVIIVDDVVTTGATVTAVARLLRQAGAGPIGVCALARTLPAGPGPAP
ncbi:MAG: phosphoribosyltransferase family protein [Arhodomonas sp.]|nr:phosphoribosyltransferase family protein [Arhodomonas sp.]